MDDGMGYIFKNQPVDIQLHKYFVWKEGHSLRSVMEDVATLINAVWL